MSINNCMSNIDNDVEHCIKVEMQTLYPEEYEKIYGNLDESESNTDKQIQNYMPRRIFTITSKEDPNKKIVLNSLSYELALEEALNELGWTISEDCDEPYKSMFEDEHMMSLQSQNLSS